MKKGLLKLFLLALVLTLGLAACARADGLTPSLTVNGAASASVAFNEAPLFRVCAPGATAVRLLANRLDQEDSPQSWDRYFDRWQVSPILEENGMKMFDSGTWRVTAAYTTDEYEDGIDLSEAELDWIGIGEVAVYVDDWLARLDPPAATLAPDSVPQGGMVTVAVSSFQHKGEWYWIELEGKTGEDEWEFLDHIDTGISEDGSDAFSVSTVGLEPGDYRLWLRCEAVRYEDNGVLLPFTVTETADPLPDVSLQLSQSATVTSQDIAMYASAPGADRMAVDIAMDGDPNWRDSRDGSGDYHRWNWSSSDGGAYILTLRAWWGDTVREADPVTLTVSAPNGDLDDPVVQNVPGVMPMGTDINGSFRAVSNAGEYHIELHYCPPVGDWERIATYFRSASDAGCTDLGLPGALFDRQGLYRLQIHAHRPGWNGGHADHQIIVTEPMDEVLSLRVNGSTDDVTGWLSLRNFHVDVSLPEAATAVRLLNGDDWEFFDARDFHGVDWSMGSGDYTLLALATDAEPVWRAEDFDWSGFSWDDLYWGMISNSVHLNVIAPYGALDDPSLSVPADVGRGEWLRVTVGEVENAERYHLRVFHRGGDGHEDYWLFDECYPAAGEIAVPTAEMAVGERYCVRVWADAEGFDSGMSAEARFTVTPGEAGECFNVSAAQALTRERVAYSAYAPGAETVRVVCGADLLSERPGDALSGSVDFDRPGRYELKAIVPDEGGWRVIGEPVVVSVTAPYGSLEAEIVAPASVAANGTAVFTVTWRHGGVRCFRETTLNSQRWEGRPLETVSVTEGETETIAVYRVRGADLYAGENCIIETWIRPEDAGYLPTRVCHELAVVEGAAQGSVSVSRSALLRCEEATVTVDVPGATALWVYHGSGDWDGFIGSHAQATWPFWQPGANQVYARYTTEPIDDPENVDFDALNWTGRTPIATVQVTALGVLDRPDYALENEIVQRGQPFRITINRVQGHDEWYIASLCDMDGRDVTQNFFWDENSRTLRVETLDVEPGLYYLQIHTDAVGYESGDVRHFVAVEEPAEGLVVSLPDSPILTQDRPTVTAYAPGAVKITLDSSDPDGAFSPRHYEQDGELFRDELVFGATEGVRRVVVTALYADGSSESHEADVQLIAPYGARPSPTLCMSGRWTEGHDLSFRVDAGSALFIAVDVQDRQTEEYVYSDEMVNFDDWRYTIPAGVFTPGHHYNIIVYSTEVGYNADETIYWMAMLPEAPATLSLPAALTEIDEEAFTGTAAQRIVIPATVTSVAARAFADCPNLLAVEIADGASGISGDAFEGSGAFMIYGRPGSSAEACANANRWATFIRLE